MEEPSLEALMQAGLIFVVGVAIILSNLLIIATYLNFRGKLSFGSLSHSFSTRFSLMLTLARRNRASVLSGVSVPFARSLFPPLRAHAVCTRFSFSLPSSVATACNLVRKPLRSSVDE